MASYVEKRRIEQRKRRWYKRLGDTGHGKHKLFALIDSGHLPTIPSRRNARKALRMISWRRL